MRQDAGEERQRLTAVYAEKYDGELLELAADSGNLTEIAQQVLRDEMQKRGLSADAGRVNAVGTTARDSDSSFGDDGWGCRRGRNEGATPTAKRSTRGRRSCARCPKVEQARQLAANAEARGHR